MCGRWAIDFLSADGHKWMLGPEGAGLFYCRADLCESLHPAVVGWLNMVDAHDYSNYRYEFQPDARRFEPGSWNVPGLIGLGASLDLLLEFGIDTVWSRVEALDRPLLRRRDRQGLPHPQPARPRRRNAAASSSLSPHRPKALRATPSVTRSKSWRTWRKQGIIVVVRNGRLRMSPHFYNTDEQIDRLVAALPG